MKIDLSEVQAQKSALSTSVGSIKGDLTKARSSLSQVVSTDSLKGVVKDTINQKVSNYQIPLLDNYSNALDSIVNRYDGIIKLFKETVGETNDSAIINTEYLERVKQRMKDPIEGLGKISTRTQSIYSDISDIISLSNPSLDDVNTTYAKAQKSLDDTIKNMEAFNNVILKTDTFDLIDMQDSQLKTLSAYSRTSYTNQTARNYYKKTQFRNSVSEINTALHSNSQNVKYQNALAKQLAESKYSGTVASTQQKDIAATQIGETFGLSLPKREEVADYIKTLGEAVITYRGSKIFLNGVEITMDSQGRMRWGNKFIFKSSTNNLYRHGRNFQNASGIDLENYHYSGNLQGVARMKEMGKAGWSGFKESLNPLNDVKGWKEVGKVGKAFKLGGGILTAAAAAGLGVAIGSAFLPPLGTVIGAGAGVAINYALNNVKLPFVGKSVVDTVKDFGKGIGDSIGNSIGNVVSSMFGG